jgi:hypothetical protein
MHFPGRAGRYTATSANAMYPALYKTNVKQVKKMPLFDFVYELVEECD